MKLETRLRNRRRSAQLGDARRVRESELEALCARLHGQHLEFEDALRYAIEGLPDWTGIDADSISALFEVRIDGTACTLGPSAALRAAEQLGEFVVRWLGGIAVDPDAGAAPEDVARWEAEVAELRRYLDEVRASAREAATEAQSTLGEQLEELLAALEDEREDQEDALRQSVNGAEVATGEIARKKEAALWEAQRERASQMRHLWSPIEELAFEGVSLAIDGLAALESLLEAIELDVFAAYPELGGSRTSPRRVRAFSVPAPRASIRDAGSPSFQVDDARRETEPLNPYETEEFARELQPSRFDTEPPAAAAPMKPRPAAVPVASVSAPPRKPAPPLEHEVVDETAHRVLIGWQPVPLFEQVLVLTGPIGYTIVLLVWLGAHQAGLAPNPFAVWDSALGAWLACATFMFVVPALLSWRVCWSARWRPRFRRWRRRSEERALRIDDRGLQIGDEIFLWSNARATLGGAGIDGQDRVLRIEAPQVDVRFASSNSAGGSASVGGSAAAPPDAWRISESTLLAIARRAGA